MRCCTTANTQENIRERSISVVDNESISPFDESNRASKVFEDPSQVQIQILKEEESPSSDDLYVY
jgi:hypothetical protein